MSERICSIDDCGRPHAARGWCRHHYQRWVTTGDPDADKPILPRNRGRKSCTVDGCARPHRARGFCHLHWRRWSTYGDPLIVGNTPGDGHSRWNGDEVTYSGAHQRVIRLRGRAKDHPCAHCEGPADDWALRWEDVPHDRVRWGSNLSAFCPYAPDTEWYHALCLSCHADYDERMRREWDVIEERPPAP